MKNANDPSYITAGNWFSGESYRSEHVYEIIRVHVNDSGGSQLVLPSID